MLGIDEIRDTIHRTWAVERNHCHDILDTRWLELFDVLGHLRALKLEDTRRLTTCQQVKGLLTFGVLLIIARHPVKRDLFQYHLLITCDLDVLERIIQDGQVREAQEVELDQAQFFQVRLFVLRNASLAGVLGITQLQRHKVIQRLICNNYACRVHACRAHHAFQLQCLINDLLRNFTFFIQVIQLFNVVQRFLERDVRPGRNEPRNAISYLLLSHHTCHVLDRRLCRHRIKRDHLCYAVLAIFVCHILNHFFTAIIREVHVDIRHIRALGVEEAFKGQLIPEGVNIRNAQRVGQQASRGRTSRGAAYTPRARIVHEVPFDEEIRRESLLNNHVEPVVKLFLDAFGHLAKAFSGTL